MSDHPAHSRLNLPHNWLMVDYRWDQIWLVWNPAHGTHSELTIYVQMCI